MPMLKFEQKLLIEEEITEVPAGCCLKVNFSTHEMYDYIT